MTITDAARRRMLVHESEKCCNEFSSCSFGYRSLQGHSASAELAS